MKWKRARDLAPAVALLAVAASPFVAAGNGPVPGTLKSGTDLVGTLPSVYAPPEEEGHLDDFVDPALQLNGPLGALDEVIQDAWGDGYVVVAGPDQDGDIDVRFHGDVTALLDPPGLERDALDVHVRLGSKYEGGLAALESGGVLGEPFPVGGQLRIPFETLIGSGLLDDDGLKLHLMNRRGAAATFTFRLEGLAVVATQEVH